MEYTETAWLSGKKNPLELSIAHNTSTNTTQDKILKQFSTIEMKTSVLPVALLKFSSYAVSACSALAYSSQEKPVQNRALKEELVKVIDNPEPSQTSRKLVKSDNTASTNGTCKVLAVIKIEGSNIMIYYK
jgi:hypothetical protein